jgi:hypothetical protein
MPTPIQRVAKALFLSVGLSAGAGLCAVGCQYPGSVIFVQSVLAWDQACTVQAAIGGLTYSQGRLDVLVANDYRVALLIGNQMVPRGLPNELKTETSRVTIEGADVRIRYQGEVAPIAEFFTVGTTTIDPSAGAVPSYGSVFLQLIDGATTQALRAGPLPAELEVEIVVRGITLGGTGVQSQPFYWPVSVTSGGLCEQLPGVDCQVVGEDEELVVPCSIGVQDPYDCRFLGGSCPG